MTQMFGKTLVGLAVMAVAGLAHANATDSSFVDVAGSVSFDGWNELNRNRTGGALTSEELVAGSVANVAGSGDAVLTRTSGDQYPASYGLYGGVSSFTFTDNTVASGITSLAFQAILNDFSAYGLGGTAFGIDKLTLSINGGTESLSPVLLTSTNTGGANDYWYFSWDLSGITTPITSYTITMDVPYSQSLAFQVDQVSAVPEPSAYAMALGGLALVGVMARRRRTLQ